MEDYGIRRAGSPAGAGAGRIGARGQGPVSGVHRPPTAFFEKLKDQPKILVPYIVYWLLFAVVLFLLMDLTFEVQNGRRTPARCRDKPAAVADGRAVQVGAAGYRVAGRVADSPHGLRDWLIFGAT